MRIESVLRTTLALGAALAAPVAAQIQPPQGFRVETVVGGLDQAVAMAFAPDGRLFVAERIAGTIRVVENGVLGPVWASVPVVGPLNAEAGLLGIAVDPDFPAAPFVYTYATRPGGGGWQAAITRIEERGGQGVNPTEIGPTIPATGRHVGGPLVFGRDGRLYVAVGDGAVDPAAQSLAAPLGKVLRLRVPDGGAPTDNPFVGVAGAYEEIWSYGHRNPFGLAIHPDTGDLYETENGRAGGDELNRIVRGGNHGWPIYDGFEPAPDPTTVDPLHTFRPDPALVGAAFYSGHLWPSAWRGRWMVAGFTVGPLLAVDVDPGSGAVTGTSTFEQNGTKYAVASGPDGNLWALQGPRPGRGADRVVRYVYDAAPSPAIDVAAVSNVAVGGSVTIGVTGSNGHAAAAWIGLTRLPNPVPTPFGLLEVPVDLPLPSLPIVGDDRVYYAIPLADDPNLRGVEVHFQGATVGAGNASLTNAVSFTLY